MVDDEKEEAEETQETPEEEQGESDLEEEVVEDSDDARGVEGAEEIIHSSQFQNFIEPSKTLNISIEPSSPVLDKVETASQQVPNLEQDISKIPTSQDSERASTDYKTSRFTDSTSSSFSGSGYKVASSSSPVLSRIEIQDDRRTEVLSRPTDPISTDTGLGDSEHRRIESRFREPDNILPFQEERKYKRTSL